MRPPAHVRIACIVPAHNEEQGIAGTLESLWWQTRVPDLIVVAADNCSDATVEVARACGADVVFETIANRSRKAGALNQALARARGADFILEMDADTRLPENTIEELLRAFDDPTVGAACVVRATENNPGLLGLWQRMDTEWWQRFIEATHPEHVFCMDGSTTMFRAAALAEVSRAPWDQVSFVEDYVLTIDLRDRGWKCVMVPSATNVTEAKRTWRELWRQRTRWAYGTMQTLQREGLRRSTRRAWWSHLWVCLVIVSRMVWYSSIACLALGMLPYDPRWLLVVPLFLAEPLTATWHLGWRARVATVSLLFNEVGYLFVNAVFMTALLRLFLRRPIRW